ncbi:peptide/nickel transport system substrate-binding protein [Devosia enhydra]|uniref:Peptide/nickel transport system substrate-binding protein n=1 Tax=Devosia enhydra TaxID=665118 RepID=A0A1K2HWE2_9HYPH|nr:ABC transporter substrate-binding protein [Devosia enhydra]SFZ83341.1 peptide/nickel transport system substrate-binding protein [Devosia enhydra]
MQSRRLLSLLAPALAAGLLTSTSALAQAAFSCPQTGGDLIVGMEAGVPTLDQHTATSSATRNVAMNIFETLVIRDAAMTPTPDLAESIETSEDGLTYTFKLRDGISFHNGKPLTTADVVASFDRYKEVGVNRATLDVVEKWEATDDITFVITLKQAQPTFLESLSSYTVPIVILPAEEAAKPANQITPIGTGPFKFVEFVPDSHVRLERYDGYVANDTFGDLSGFAGHKQACVDTVTFRMLTEAGARMAALETGEVHIVENVPAISQERLAGTAGVEVVRLENFALNVAYPNWSAPPTDNALVRQAMLAALDMEEIMEAATDGAFKLNPSFQFPDTGYYSTAGEEFYNQADPEKARALLAEAGYTNEPIVLLTNQQFPNMYNSALVMAAQLQAAGMNAELRVLDWPTALATSEKETAGWNVFFTFWATVTAQGGPTSLRNLANPNNVYKPVNNEGDAAFNEAFARIQSGADLETRRAAFAEAQAIAFEQVMAIPFGIMQNAQGIRANVENYQPYYNTRVSNVWLEQ